MSILRAGAGELHRYSVDEYERLVAAGAFRDTNVELIDGLVLDMSPKSPQHENVVQWLTYWFIDRLDRSRFQLRVSAPLRLQDGEPEPDIAVCQAAGPRERHPSSAALVVEVALSSVERDLTVKPERYAPAVSEYWVIDLDRRELIAHRHPGASGYSDVDVYDAESTVTAEALGVEATPLTELFAAAGPSA